MDPNDALQFAVLAGEIMLSSGAETYRVEDTVLRILSNCNFTQSESFVTTTGLFASVIDQEAGTITMVKRVKNRTNNYERIVMVNDISRSFAEGKIEVAEAIKSLHEINAKPPYPPFVVILATGTASFACAYIFGGSPFDGAGALFTGIILQLFLLRLRRSHVAGVLIHMLGAALIAFMTLCLLNIGIGNNLDKMIIGSIMPLVPGVAITNAVRDVLEGDYLSGTARGVDALIVGIAIATGVGTVLKLWIYVFGGIYI